MLSETIKNGIVMYCPSNRIANPHEQVISPKRKNGVGLKKT